jgi:hypothetical protein
MKIKIITTRVKLRILWRQRMIEDRKHQKGVQRQIQSPTGTEAQNRRKRCKPRKLHHQEESGEAREQIEEN